MKKSYTPWLIILGILFFALGAYYWSIKAGSLPHWLPGYEAGVARRHFKHGLAAVILGLGCFVWAWFASGSGQHTARSADAKPEQSKDSE